MSRKSAVQLVTIAQTHVLGKPLRNRVCDDILKLKDGTTGYQDETGATVLYLV
jgi:hypothetical protein